MAKERLSFLEMLLSKRAETERERKVLGYVCHRIGDGAHLGEVTQEEYVRRNSSPEEVRHILEDPRLVETAREKMREDFFSGLLVPKPPPSAANGGLRTLRGSIGVPRSAS